MERPGLAFAALMALAIGFILFISRGREVDKTMSEREELKMQEQMKQLMEGFTPLKGDARQQAFKDLASTAIQGELEIEGLGTLKLELYDKAAPKTVAQITKLAKQGFYTGQRFHRVVDGFVAQVGDPASKNTKKSDFEGLSAEEAMQKLDLGKGGSGITVPRELKLPHLAMTLGLARGGDPNSGDSQFFINLKENENLDSGYCVFGRVVGGQEIASKIRMGDMIKSFRILK